jgi:hypothetical protein
MIEGLATPGLLSHPDRTLGAGVLASRLGGHSVERVLVDVSPYSFGISYIGDRGGYEYPYCYRPIVQRNTPLPLTRPSGAPRVCHFRRKSRFRCIRAMMTTR